MVMHPGIIGNTLIVFGEGFWVLSAAAQLKRLVHTRNTKGLNAVTLTLNAAGNMGWCTYFAQNHLWYPFVTNIFVISLTIAILGYTLSNNKQFYRGLVAIVIIGPLTSFILFHYPLYAGWLGAGYNWIAGTPQLARIIHRKKVSGLSENGLFFALGAMLMTMTYAFIIHSSPLKFGCAQALVYMSITMRYYYRHRKHG